MRSRESPLTSAEEEVLGYAALGFSDKAIATALQISRKTVSAHLQSIYRKLGCHNRTAAAHWFLTEQRDA